MKKISSILIYLFSYLLISGSSFAGPYTNDGIAGFVGDEVNPVFVGWATGYTNYTPFDLESIQNYQGGAYADPDKTLGEVTGSGGDIASLGDMNADAIAAWQSDPINNPGPGEITLTFNNSIYNGDGYDFAVFENSFFTGDKLFAELGYVEVSTDGTNFVRFDSISLTEGLVGGYGAIDPTDVYNLAGKHPNNYGSSEGTGFDLNDLAENSLVLSGLVDLNDINYVKIVDIPGSGDFLDSEGNPIYDSWVTWGSGGVDLEAVGVINAVPIPGAVWLLSSGLLAVTGIRKRKMNKTRKDY